MDEEFTNIRVPVIRLSNGDLTCKNGKKECQFLLRSDVYEGEFTCCFLAPKFEEGPRPDLTANLDSGWLIPHNNCPIKNQNQNETCIA